MSYIMPNSSDVSASWLASTPYTRQASNAANAQFSGSTLFIAAGIASTQFGVPSLVTAGPYLVSPLNLTRFGTPSAEEIWPSGAMPVGWDSPDNSWQYDAAEGRTVLGSLRLTLYETDTYGTLISSFYPLPSGGKFKFWIKRSRISAADCRIIFQAVGQTDIEAIFDQPTGEYVAVESPFLPAADWRVQLQGRNNSAGVITSFWIDDFTVESGSVAQSLYSTHFGIPVRTNAFEASSLQSTVIPSPAIAFPTRQRNSLRSSRFGTHLAVGAEQRCFANSLISSRFGRPVRLPTFEFRAAGWAGSRFGVPMLGGWKPRIIYNIIVSAEPTRTTQFGTPTLGP